MATKQQALKVLEKLGATLDLDCARYGSYTIDAPKGFVFNANREHSMFVGDYDRHFTPMTEIWQFIVEEAGLGISQCDSELCSRPVEDDQDCYK